MVYPLVPVLQSRKSGREVFRVHRTFVLRPTTTSPTLIHPLIP